MVVEGANDNGTDCCGYENAMMVDLTMVMMISRR